MIFFSLSKLILLKEEIFELQTKLSTESSYKTSNNKNIENQAKILNQIYI